MKQILFTLIPALCVFYSCSGQNSGNTKTKNSSNMTQQTGSQNKQYADGKDYTLFERVRLMDKTGFNTPVEAYSLLIPKGWNSDGNIYWNAPGTNCAGTYKQMKATSADGKYSFSMLPDVLYSWNTDPQMQQFNQAHGQGNFCGVGQPMNAEAYLRNVFARELGGVQVLSVESNRAVVEHMQRNNQKAMEELQQYGAGPMQFDQTAVNAVVRWKDGSEGMVTLGITIIVMNVPNNYTGGYTQSYTTSVMQRTIFKYPAAEAENAKNLYTMIMSSFRTNPGWNDAVNDFWKQARQRSNIVHVGKIRAMDEQTRRIGERAIQNGEQRLKSMDTETRTWEQTQNTNDRMHTEFIKTIREVENFQDEKGKWEMSSHYNHAWSRGDGTNFIMTNDPNFNPASVFQDQNWKQMKKVH